MSFVLLPKGRGMVAFKRFWCVISFFTAGLLASVPAHAGPGANSKISPPGSNAYGASYGEWSASHWQWLYSLPVDAHPLADTADCGAGQSGHVWFIGGTFASTEIVPGVFLGEVDRTCTIPSGTALFFPLVAAEASTIEGNGTSEDELRDAATFFADFADPSSLVLEIDGVPVTDLEDLRTQSPLFTFGPLPENNLLQNAGYDAPEGSTSPSVSDGYWVMLKPLSVGTHTLHFGGVVDLSPVGGPLFVQDITYTITVVPRGKY